MKPAEIRTLLPAVFREGIHAGDPGDALLHVMSALQEPSENVLADIDAYFDPRRTPDRFVRYLAAWLDLDRFLPRTQTIALPQLREWIASAAQLSRWRGTSKGLRLLLETATGARGFDIVEGIDSNGRPRPFHLRVIAPAEARPQRALIERILELEKPAYVTWEPVTFAGAAPDPGKG